MDSHSKIVIFGHGDVIEKSLDEYFRRSGFSSVLSSARLGLSAMDRKQVDGLFSRERPDIVILTSLKSGGIGANQARPAEFIYDNLESQNNVIHAAHKSGVKKFLFVAASCVYPKDCPQPMKEECFLTGAMEKTSEPYSMAKAAGIIMCQAYRRQYGFPAIVAVPATVYGAGFEDDVEASHVMGALIGKFHKAIREKAESVTLLGTGMPRREFIHADDFASACHFLLDRYDEEAMINIGSGSDISIRELADMVKNASCYKGAIKWDSSRPDGAMRKLLDSSRLSALGWRPRIALDQGVRSLYKAFETQSMK